MLEESRRGHGISPGTGLAGGCERPRGCWELSSDPLHEQQALVITNQSISSDPRVIIFKGCVLSHAGGQSSAASPP